MKPDPDLAPGRKARAPKEGGPPASKHSGFYQTVHAGMQGKRHVLLALEIPGKPDHFTVLRPSTGPAVKPMKLDELNSRSALSGWLAQLGQGGGFGLLHACSGVSGPICKGPFQHSLACCLLHIGLCAEVGMYLGYAVGTDVHCSVAFCLAWTRSNSCRVVGHAALTIRRGSQASAVMPWAVHTSCTAEWR